MEEEQEEEEEDAAGAVDTLSNKANHSAVVLFCYNSILMICFHLFLFFILELYIEAGLIYKTLSL